MDIKKAKPKIRITKTKVIVSVPKKDLEYDRITEGGTTPVERAFIAGFRYGGYLKAAGKKKSIQHYEFNFER